MRLQWLLLAALLQPSCTFFLGQLSTLNQKSSNLLTSINLRLFRKPQPITTVVLDADGTTLNPDHEMTESVAAAINEARDAGLRVIMATGRARGGPWVDRILTPMNLTSPGVFLQGLTAFDESDVRIHDQLLDPSAVAAVEAVCVGDDRITLCAYCQEQLITPTYNSRTEMYCGYDDAQCVLPDNWEECNVEADPWCVGDAVSAARETGAPGVSKLLLLGSGDTEMIDELQAKLKRKLRFQPARVVRALDWTLEILPSDASKGNAVRVLLDELGVDPMEVMAVGDGENDMEMLKMVGHPVAMGNAVPKLKKIAKHVVGTNGEDGVAQALREIAMAKAD